MKNTVEPDFLDGLWRVMMEFVTDDGGVGEKPFGPSAAAAVTRSGGQPPRCRSTADLRTARSAVELRSARSQSLLQCCISVFKL